MKALYLSFHRWRGFNLRNDQPDMFSVVFGLGFVTVYVCRRCLLDAYRKLRRTMEHVVGDDEQGGTGR